MVFLNKQIEQFIFNPSDAIFRMNAPSYFDIVVIFHI